MTADTARLRALLAEATPGPWTMARDGVIGHPSVGDEGQPVTVFLAEPWPGHEADATLIVEAVNALPALLDRLERLERVDPALDTLIDTLSATRDRLERAEAALAAAHFVAEHWRDALMASLDRFPNNAIGTHPLALVLAAMDGETDPVHLGLNEDAHEAFRALAASEPPACQRCHHVPHNQGDCLFCTCEEQRPEPPAEENKKQFEADIEYSGPNWKERALAAENKLTSFNKQHIVEFSETGYGLQHPLSCRPNLIDCTFNQYLSACEGPDYAPGRYVMTWLHDGPIYTPV